MEAKCTTQTSNSYAVTPVIDSKVRHSNEISDDNGDDNEYNVHSNHKFNDHDVQSRRRNYIRSQLPKSPRLTGLRNKRKTILLRKQIVPHTNITSMNSKYNSRNQRLRYYTDDNIASLHKHYNNDHYDGNDIIVTGSDISSQPLLLLPPSPPLLLPISPSSTVTSTAIFNRHFLRSRLNRTTKVILVDDFDNECNEDGDNEYNLDEDRCCPSSIAKSLEQRIVAPEQSLNHIIRSISPTVTIRTSPEINNHLLCYNMTMDENPFCSNSKSMTFEVEQEIIQHGVALPTSRSCSVSPIQIHGNRESMSSSGSTVSSIGIDSFRRYNNNMNQEIVPSDVQQSLFPPVEIFIYPKQYKPKKQVESDKPVLAEVQPTILLNNTVMNHLDWSESWIQQQQPQATSVPPPLPSLPQRPTTEYHDENVPLPLLVSNNGTAAPALPSFSPPSNPVANRSPVYKAIPVKRLHDGTDISLKNATTTNNLIRNNVFIPIPDDPSVDGDEEEEDENITIHSPVDNIQVHQPNDLVSSSPSKLLMSSSTKNVNKTRTNEIFRQRLSYQQNRPPAIRTSHQRAKTTTATSTLINSTKNTTQQQPRRRQFHSATTSRRNSQGVLRKPMSIQVPSKSVPNTRRPQNAMNTDRRHSYGSGSRYSTCTELYKYANMDNNTMIDNMIDDPLLCNIPRRKFRNGRTSMSVFSFGSIVGESVHHTNADKPQSTNNANKFQSNSPFSSKKDKNGDDGTCSSTDNTTTNNQNTNQNGETDNSSDRNIEFEKRTKKYYTNQSNYFHVYWKQITKTTMNMMQTIVVDKPQSIASLQRNSSGCLT